MCCGPCGCRPKRRSGWRLRVLRAGRAIIELERRARAAAKAQGKGDALAEVEAPLGAEVVSAEETDAEVEEPEGVPEQPSPMDAET